VDRLEALEHGCKYMGIFLRKPLFSIGGFPDLRGPLLFQTNFLLSLAKGSLFCKPDYQTQFALQMHVGPLASGGAYTDRLCRPRLQVISHGVVLWGRNFILKYSVVTNTAEKMLSWLSCNDELKS